MVDLQRWHLSSICDLDRWHISWNVTWTFRAPLGRSKSVRINNLAIASRDLNNRIGWDPRGNVLSLESPVLFTAGENTTPHCTALSTSKTTE